MPDEPREAIRFDMHALGLKERHLVVGDIDDLPDLVGVRAMVSKKRLQERDLLKCVWFDLWKGDHGGVPEKYDPSGRQVPDNQLHAMLLATLCLRKELEAELDRRAEFRARVNKEIEGLTGSDGA